MEEPAQGAKLRNRTFSFIATAAFIAVLVGLAVISLPKGFDTDLTKIGAGKLALVFVYDPNLVVSNQQTTEMGAVRELLGDALHFLIADVGRPDAQQFMQRHRARPTQLLLFAPDGNLLGKMDGLVTSEELLKAIEDLTSGPGQEQLMPRKSGGYTNFSERQPDFG
jgi:hypothetical protein